MIEEEKINEIRDSYEAALNYRIDTMIEKMEYILPIEFKKHLPNYYKIHETNKDKRKECFAPKELLIYQAIRDYFIFINNMSVDFSIAIKFISDEKDAFLLFKEEFDYRLKK